MNYRWTGELFEWRGPAPFYFIAMTEADAADLAEVAADVTYGWGVVPVRVRVGHSEWTTSLFPRQGQYLVPLKAKVRADERLEAGDQVAVQLWIEPRDGRPAG